MAITIDQLRNFTGTHSLKLDSTGDGVQSVNKWQRFKSFFGFGSARKENRQTVDAIRTAIQEDPRFFAEDVQQRAKTLLDGVRTDRAIGVAQVKSILAELDHMSEDWKRRLAAKDIATGHLAARPLPAFAQGHEDDYVSLAVNTILRDEPKEGYGRMNYAARLNDFDRTMDELFDRLSPDGVAEDREVLSQVCWGMFLSFDNGLKSRDKLEGTVDQLRGLIQEGRAAGAKYGEETCGLVLDVLKSLGKPLGPGTVTSLVDIGHSVSKHGIEALNANSSADEIHKALFGLSEELSHGNVGASNLVGVDETFPVRSLLSRSAVASLTVEQKRGMLDALESEAGKNLLAFYEEKSNTSSSANNLYTSIAMMVVQLKTSLGIENPNAPIERPRNADHNALPQSVLEAL